MKCFQSFTMFPVFRFFGNTPSPRTVVFLAALFPMFPIALLKAVYKGKRGRKHAYTRIYAISVSTPSETAIGNRR